MKILLSPPTVEDFIRLLRAWRFWLLGALIGSLLGVAVYTINPPAYRARATVVVNFNMEKSWPNKPDNELFYYLERESRKVEEIAWSDPTLEQVAEQSGIEVTRLRSGILELSQPQDGGWHFYATDPSADAASRLAAFWAQAFTKQVLEGIQTAVELDAARKALEASPSDTNLQSQIKDLEARAIAITPELQVSLSQEENLPVARTGTPGNYAMAGAGIFLAVTGLLILFWGNGRRG